MVLDMVVHIQIEESMNRIHVYGAAVQSMIEDIFRQSGMLRVAVEDHQPSAEEVRQTDKHQGENAVGINGQVDDSKIK